MSEARSEGHNLYHVTIMLRCIERWADDECIGCSKKRDRGTVLAREGADLWHAVFIMGVGGPQIVLPLVIFRQIPQQGRGNGDGLIIMTRQFCQCRLQKDHCADGA